LGLKWWILLIMLGTAFVVTGTLALSVQPLQSPEKTRKGKIHGIGTVRYLSFEGGFWGIESDDGAHYDVGSVPREFQVDGLRVRFSVNLAHDTLSYHMWGQVAELVSIEKL
jgi:hypothetical protein